MARSSITISPGVSQTAGAVRYEFALEYSNSTRIENVFYEFPRDLAPPVPEAWDGILCGVILHAMAERRDLRLRGAVTRAGLLNLQEFQLAWSRWLPELYQPVAIEAESVITSPRPRPARAIAAFSGGVDATFTLLRNSPNAKSLGYAIDTVLMVHGFDVALANERAFRDVIDRTAPVREATGVRLAFVRTNSKELGLQDWLHSFGPELAACLHLFSAEYSTALIASSEPYDALVLPVGSSPVTDHLLSGGSLRIVHDGAAFSRTEKIAFLSTHPAAMQSLKVCWKGADQGRNCGVCEKCLRTQLNLLAVGVSDAACFDAPFDPGRIPQIAIRNDAVLAEFRSILAYAERHDVDAEWVRLLRRRVRQGLTTAKPKTSFRSQVRRSLERAGLLGLARRLKRSIAGQSTR